MMLNMRRTFDEMVLEHTSPDKAEQIFANPFYQTVASSFGGTQEYMAMEKLGQLANRREWDLIVVDTPRPVTRWTSWTRPNGSAISSTAG